MVNLLFDYDGTLHDSLAIYAPAVLAAYDDLASRGLAVGDPPDRETIRRWIGMTPSEMWEQFQPQLSSQEKQAGGAYIGRRMQELVEEGKARLYPGVPQVLDALKKLGVGMLLLSNCPVSYLRAHTACFGLERWFDGLYCGEQFQYLPKYEILPILKKRWPGEFLVIGDRNQDMEMARKNQVSAVGCTYGYGSPEELSGADWLAGTPEEVPYFVREFLGTNQVLEHI